jgi:hypothetical protein
MITQAIQIHRRKYYCNCKLIALLLTLLFSLPILALTSFYINQCAFNNINSSVKLCTESRTITPTGYYDHYLVIPNTNNLTSNIYYYFAYLSGNNLIKTICDQNIDLPNYVIGNYSVNKYTVGYRTILFINVDTDVCNIVFNNSSGLNIILLIFALSISLAISFVVLLAIIHHFTNNFNRISSSI